MDLRVELPKIRVLPSSEDRLRTLTQGADHAEAWAEKARAMAEPAIEKLVSLRTRLATAAVAILAVWLFFHVTFGANGMVVYRGKRAEYQSLQKDIDRLQKENAEYSEQVNQLKSDPKRIEREAREQFHYARPGEVVYVSPEPAAASPPPVTHSASK
jgi:cell division protein FtsB